MLEIGAPVEEIGNGQKGCLRRDPPRELLTASEACPDHAAVTEAVIPDSEVAAPMNRAPMIASPIPVRRASSPATRVIRTPNTAINIAASAKIRTAGSRASVIAKR